MLLDWLLWIMLLVINTSYCFPIFANVLEPIQDRGRSQGNVQLWEYLGLITGLSEPISSQGGSSYRPLLSIIMWGGWQRSKQQGQSSPCDLTLGLMKSSVDVR